MLVDISCFQYRAKLKRGAEPIVEFTPAINAIGSVSISARALEKVRRVEPKKKKGTNPSPKARCGSRFHHPLLVLFYTASNGRYDVCKMQFDRR